MAKPPLTETPLLDILPPPAPVDQTLLLTVLLLGVMGLVLFGLYLLWQRRPRQRALHQLTQLQRRLEQQAVDNRQCLYEINHLLCQGLALNSLARMDNQSFYQRLSRLQYRAAAPEHDETQRLLAEACLLLRGGR